MMTSAHLSPRQLDGVHSGSVGASAGLVLVLPLRSVKVVLDLLSLRVGQTSLEIRVNQSSVFRNEPIRA